MPIYEGDEVLAREGFGDQMGDEHGGRVSVRMIEEKVLGTDFAFCVQADDSMAAAASIAAIAAMHYIGGNYVAPVL